VHGVGVGEAQPGLLESQVQPVLSPQGRPAAEVRLELLLAEDVIESDVVVQVVLPGDEHEATVLLEGPRLTAHRHLARVSEHPRVDPVHSTALLVEGEVDLAGTPLVSGPVRQRDHVRGQDRVRIVGPHSETGMSELEPGLELLGGAPLGGTVGSAGEE
jgi:hypothetical protein